MFGSNICFRHAHGAQAHAAQVTKEIGHCLQRQGGLEAVGHEGEVGALELG